MGGAKVGLMAPQGTRQLAEKTIPVAKSVRRRRVGQRFFSNLLFRLGVLFSSPPALTLAPRNAESCLFLRDL